MMKPSRESFRRAVALRYNAQSDPAPKIVAKGDRLLADRIIALAREHNIHVHEDPALASLLAKIDVDAYVPEELYRAVAEVLAFVYRLNNKTSPVP